MAEIVKRIDYYYTVIPNQTGAGAKVFYAFKADNVNLIAINGFPTRWQRTQLDLVPFDRDTFLAVAKKAEIKLVGPKVAFLIQGEDRVGAVADVIGKLWQAKINITAMQAISGGEGRYGAILWVNPSNINKAAQALGIS